MAAERKPPRDRSSLPTRDFQGKLPPVHTTRTPVQTLSEAPTPTPAGVPLAGMGLAVIATLQDVTFRPGARGWVRRGRRCISGGGKKGAGRSWRSSLWAPPRENAASPDRPFFPEWLWLRLLTLPPWPERKHCRVLAFPGFSRGLVLPARPIARSRGRWRKGPPGGSGLPGRGVPLQERRGEGKREGRCARVIPGDRLGAAPSKRSGLSTLPLLPSELWAGTPKR